MKKFVRAISGRAICMFVLAIFLIPTLLLPFAGKGYAALDRQNILLLPLDAIVADVPTSLTATMQQQVAAALMQRTGVQVDIFSKKSSAIRNVEQHLDEAGKDIFKQSIVTALNANADPNQRFKAAAIMGKLLGMDAVIYGTIDGYDLATKNGVKVRQMRLSATAVVIDRSETVDITQDINAERILLTAKGFSSATAASQRSDAQMDIEAINELAENIAYQYTGTTVNTSLTSPLDAPEKKSVKRKSYTGWIFGGLTLAAIAMFANGSGSSTQVTPPPPTLPAPVGIQTSVHFAGGDSYETRLSWEITGNTTPTKINIYRTEGGAVGSRITTFFPANFSKHAVAHRSSSASRSNGAYQKQAPGNIRSKGVMAAGIAETRGTIGGLARTFIDRPVELDTTYTYEIEAVYGNVSVRSNPFTVSTIYDTRNYSSNITAADTEGNVSIDWDSAGTVSLYRVFRSTSYDPAFNKATKDDLSRYFRQIKDVHSLSYLDMISEYGKTYSYVVVPYFSSSDPYRGIYQVASVTPVRLLGSVSPSADTQLDYSSTNLITAVIKDINGNPLDKVELTYQFEGLLPNGTTLQETKQTDATGTASAELKTGKVYGYGRVVVFWDKDGDGRLDVSTDPAINELVGRTGYLIVGLATPTGVTATLVSNTSVRVEWNRATYGPNFEDPDAYYVERRTDLTGTWTVISPSLTSTFFIDTTVEVGKTYEYRVYSMLNGIDIESAKSNSASITLAKPLPDTGTLTPSTATHRVIKASTDFPITVNTVGVGGLAVGSGHNIRFILTKIYGSNSATLDVYTKETDDVGSATVVLRPGADFGRVTVQAYYDKNGNGVMDAGENFGSTGVLVVGLTKPDILTATYNATTGNVDLTWPQLGVNEQYGDGFVIERQMEGDANWVKLPAINVVNTPGVTVDLDKTLNAYTYTDSFFLVPGKKFTYRVKTVAIESGIESATTSSQQILLPMFEPISGVISPETADYTIIDPAVVQPITVTVLDKNHNPVGNGFVIKFKLTRDFQAGTATLSAMQAVTDDFGMVSVNLTSGTAFGKVTIQAFYDKNGNNIIDAGEAMGTPVKLVLGLVKPAILNAVYNSATGNVDLNWTALQVNEQFGDGFIIERQMEGDANWVRLPASGPVSVPGLTVNLGVNSFIDNYNLLTGMKYTYRIKNVVVSVGIESDTTSSLQILVPQLEPARANILPMTADYTIINPAVTQPITLTVLDRNDHPVGAGFLIKFILTKDFQAGAATLSPMQASTDATGVVTTILTPGTLFGKVTIQGYYDKNGNNVLDAGEAMGTPVKLVLGLVKPEIFTAAYDDPSGNVILNWSSLNINEQYGDGFIIERQMEGDATWVRLPATAPVSVPGLTTNLNVTNFIDSYNLQAGKKYTYRIKTVVVSVGLESGTTSSLQISVPQLEPVSANIDPVTPSYTIVNPTIAQPVSLTILDKNGRPVGAGFLIKFVLTKDFQAATATLAPLSASTDAAGVVTTTLTPGTAFGKVTIQAYYDKNGNNVIDVAEAMGTPVKLVLGLVRPEIFNAVYDSVSGNVNLNWSALNINEQYGDGFIIERQMEGDTTWVRLPATAPVSVPGLTVNLSATSFIDNYNLQTDKKYTYRIKTVVVAVGLESATNTSLQIEIPKLEPVSGNIDPVTPDYTIIDSSVAQTITVVALDKNGRSVGAGFPIKFRLTKVYGGSTASLSVQSANTDENGIVTVVLTPGAAFGKVLFRAFYDRNKDNVINTGEQMGGDVKFVLGLLRPNSLTASFNSITTAVDLSWLALNLNGLYGDGLLIERQMEGDATWVALPPAGGAVDGTSALLTATSYSDTFNLQYGKKYTYRIKNIDSMTGLESAVTTSNVISLPDLPPDTTTTVIPSTQIAVELGAGISTPFTFMVKRNNMAVAAGVNILFKLRKAPTTMTASLSVSEALTDQFGIVKVNLLSGTTLGMISIEAYFDLNNNGIAESTELLKSTTKIIVGLNPPTNLSGVYNVVSKMPHLSWLAPAEGEGFLVQRRRVSPLPVTPFVTIATLPGLATTQWDDNVNPLPGHEYEYQVLTYWQTDNDVLSDPSSAVSVTLPSLTPTSGVFVPDVPVGESFIFINRAGTTTFTFLANDSTNNPVSTADIAFRKKIISGAPASVTVPVNPVETDINGFATINVDVADSLVIFQLEAYYDANNNGFYEPTEIIATTGRLTSGLSDPTSISALPVIPASIKVNWSYVNVGGFADNFIIERQIDGGTWDIFRTQSVTDPMSFTDVQLDPSKSYAYRVIAENSQYNIRSNAVSSLAVNPPADQVIDSISVSLLTPNAGKIYYSEDIDDQLAVGLATRSTIQISGTAGARASAFAVVSLSTSRGRFLQLNPGQTLSNGNKTIQLTLDGAGKATVALLGRADNGAASSFVELPGADEFGKPVITAEDSTAKVLNVTGGSNFLTIVGPAHTLSLTTIVPDLGFDIPQYNEGINVLFQDKAGTLEVTAYDANGEIVLPGMPIWATQSWDVLQNKDNLNEVNYNRKSLGASLIANHILLTDNAGKATTAISSNFSGLFTYRAFAVNKLSSGRSAVLKNINSQTGGYSDADLAIIHSYLLDRSLTDESPVTAETQLMHKTYVKYDSWEKAPDNWPNNLIPSDGTVHANLTFIAKDDNGKRVLPGTPYRVSGLLSGGGTVLSTEVELLQLNQTPILDSQILGFDDQAKAGFLVRGKGQIGKLNLRFNTTRTVGFTSYLTDPDRAGNLEAYATLYGATITTANTTLRYGDIPEYDFVNPNRLASITAQADPATPRTTVFPLRFLNGSGQPIPAGYKVRLFSTNANIPAGSRFDATGYTDINGRVSFTYTSPNLASIGLDSITDSMSLELSGFDSTGANTIVTGWFVPSVITEQPASASLRINNAVIPANPYYPLESTNYNVTLYTRNSFGQASLPGFQIKYVLTLTGGCNATVNPATVSTDASGIVTFTMTGSTEFGTARVQFYYDKNNSGSMSANEILGDTGVLDFGLAAPIAPTATATSTLAGVSATLKWPDVQNEDAYLVMRKIKDVGDFVKLEYLGVDRTINGQAGGTVTFVDNNLAGNTTYEYKVIAVRINNVATTTVYSKESPVLSFLTPPARPNPPTLAKKDDATLSVFWTTLPDTQKGTAYLLMRHSTDTPQPDPNVDLTGWDNALPPPGSTDKLQFDDTNPGLPGKTWVYVIRSRNASGDSPWSLASAPEEM